MFTTTGKKFVYLLAGGLIPFTASTADDDHKDNNICMGEAPSILDVADFDGNGIVDQNDIVIIKHARKQKTYYAFYDINADGKFNKRDIQQAETHLGLSSSNLDQQKAILFHQIKQLQIVDNEPELSATRYVRIAPSLAGHGEHWTFSLPDSGETAFRPGGLNFSAEDSSAKGVFWSHDATPVFENGATDYPQPGGEWMTSRVIAFSDQAPNYTESADEIWHTHAGLCVTANNGSNGIVPVLHQHTTFAECQSLPTLVKTGGDYNLWFNIWMLHGWMFDLNPNGFFAGTHPCVDSDSPTEDSINEGREVPHFFQHH